MTFKQAATYFATVVLTSALAIGSLLGFIFTVAPESRYVGFAWAIISFTVIVVVATCVGMISQYEYEQRKR